MIPNVLGSLDPLVSSLASPLAAPKGLSSNDAGGHRHHCFYGGLRGRNLYMFNCSCRYIYMMKDISIL